MNHGPESQHLPGGSPGSLHGNPDTGHTTGVRWKYCLRQFSNYGE